MKLSWTNIGIVLFLLWYCQDTLFTGLKMALWNGVEMHVVDRQETCSVRRGGEWEEIAEGCNAANRIAFDEDLRFRRDGVLNVEWTARDGGIVREEYALRDIDGDLWRAGPGSVVYAYVHPEGTQPPVGPLPWMLFWLFPAGAVLLLWHYSPFAPHTVLGNADIDDGDTTILCFRQALLKWTCILILWGQGEAGVERIYTDREARALTLSATVLASDGHCAADGAGVQVCRKDAGERNEALIAFDHPVAGPVVKQVQARYFAAGMPVPGETIVIHESPRAASELTTPAFVAARDHDTFRPWVHYGVGILLALFLWLSLIEWRVLPEPDWA